MVEESVKCGRCDKWFQREKEENREIKKAGKAEGYLCPECDEQIKKSD